MKQMTIKAIWVGALLLSTACTQIDAVQGARDQSRAEVGPLPGVWQASSRSGEVLNGWLAAYRDPVLTQLVQEAITRNQDLKVAALNVQKAATLVRQANASRFPSLDGSAGVQKTGNVDLGGQPEVYSVGLQAQWEIDIWGRLSSGARAARFQRDVAAADLQYSQLSMAAGVSKAYFGALEARQQAWVTLQVRNSLAELQGIAKAQFDAGAASRKDLALVDVDLAQANEKLIEVRGQVRQAERALQVLLGRYPSAQLNLRKSLPRIPRQPGAGIPSTLLERRPDLYSAERTIAAAFEGINQAQAARLPAFSLTAAAAGSSTELSNVLNSGNLGWSIAANILVPIFHAGALKAKVDQSTIEQRQAVHQYASAALNAFQEVENELDQGRILAGRHNAIETARREAREALRLIRLSYQQGESTLQEVLQVEQKVFSANSAYQTLHRLRLEQFADLNVALGGDWHVPVPPTPAEIN